MTIQKTIQDQKATLTIVGKINTTTSVQLQETLLPVFDEAKEVTLDFCGVEYISSAGLRVLFTGHEAALNKGSLMILKNVTDDIREIFQMTGFLNILVIE